MCLAVPGKVLSVDGTRGVVDFGGIKRDANLSLLRDVSVGDYVLIHAGFAIQKLDRREAEKTLEAWEDVLGSGGEIPVPY